MINVAKLYEFKPSFGFFAQQLMYPEKLDFHPAFLEASFDQSHPAYTHAHTYWSLMQEFSMEEIQEMYTETFDFQKNCALYMTYFKFEDAKERGQMLVKLKVLYEMYGLEMPDGELPDYLPLMCEFLYAAEWVQDAKTTENFRMPIAILEDGTYHLLKALEKMESPYFHLIKGLRETLKACVEQEAATL
ncbi:nitrate reductase molybdenum cofactor assembly chaperone [Paenibacillus ottowii]|uniref:Nitrate reductase molybdenum cofactor assembly chaperone n=1 Tax=Paenibacillus ottowii TaxID=2315729 RepID=A0ABY3B326_9BACL|nr:nitrate reductase molybdenum cofactor assembly chaperone [Paenibacillus ottowii]NEU28753.1 nitrate reductase molybdenum cofactor assembly chaperone [Paenibacillus polymyxa]TQR98157.1 nitrate reductase molybdenum cofactor assembly chaperone [Paenibacillus ottowii]